MASNLQVKLLRNLSGHSQAVYTACKGVDNSIISAGGDGHIVQWFPTQKNDGISIGKVPEPIYSLVFDPVNELLLAGSQSGHLYVLEKGLPRKIVAHKGGLFSIIFTEMGIITAGGDGFLMHWNKQLELIQKVQIALKSIRRIIMIPGGFASASSDGCVYLLSPELKVWDIWTHHQNSVFALEYIHQSASLVSGGRDAFLYSRTITTLENEINIAAHLLHIHDIKLSPGREFLASSSMDKTIKIWDPVTLELLKVLDKPKFGIHSSSVNSLVWLDDTVLISVSDDRSLGVFRIMK